MEEDKLYAEIKQLRYLLAKVVGTQDLPKREQFSKEAIKNAALEFRKLQTERGEWIPEHDISKIIRKAGYLAGRFIIKKFDFKNYYVRGQQYFYSRKDLVALNKELKARKINLGRYMELEEDKEKFHKYLDDMRQGNKRRPRFKIPEELMDVETQPYNHPPKEKVLGHIETLMNEFKEDKLIEFIDIYCNGNYAMIKNIYHFDRYIDNEKWKQCKKWCFEYNYARNALKEIKKIRSQVIY